MLLVDTLYHLKLALNRLKMYIHRIFQTLGTLYLYSIISSLERGTFVYRILLIEVHIVSGGKKKKMWKGAMTVQEV